jgi:pimeloyl-ACP methyl ester carboxylesterase
MYTRKRLAIEKIGYSHSYKKTTIPYTIWSNWDGNKAIGTIIFLGTVQIEKLAKWVIENCPPNSIVVQGAPHWFAKSDGGDIPEYMFDFTKCAFNALLKNFPIAKVHILAESQAVPGVVGLFAQDEYSPYLKKMTLLQPLGLNIHAYLGTAKQRIEIFRRRIAANFLYQVTALMLDKRLRYNHRLANRMVGIALRNPKARAQYSSGLMHDAIPNLKRLFALHKDIVVICGANDKIFPPAEIITALTNNGIDMEVQTIKGIPHSPLATRHGQKLLAAALNR